MDGYGWPDGKPLPTRKPRKRDRRGRQRRKLISRYPCCIWCGYRFLSANDATIEHVVPRRFGGRDRLDNMALACYECNNARGQWYNQFFGHRNAVRFPPRQPEAEG